MEFNVLLEIMLLVNASLTSIELYFYSTSWNFNKRRAGIVFLKDSFFTDLVLNCTPEPFNRHVAPPSPALSFYERQSR
jgi:hypothetical protein